MSNDVITFKFLSYTAKLFSRKVAPTFKFISE